MTNTVNDPRAQPIGLFAFKDLAKRFARMPLGDIVHFESPSLQASA